MVQVKNFFIVFVHKTSFIRRFNFPVVLSLIVLPIGLVVAKKGCCACTQTKVVCAPLYFCAALHNFTEKYLTTHRFVLSSVSCAFVHNLGLGSFGVEVGSSAV